MYCIRRRSVTLSIAALALVGTSGVALAAPPPADAVQQLIDADRAFSTSAHGKNVVDSIAQFLADDAKSPKGDGTFAKSKQEIIDVLKSNPLNLVATADWAPVRGGISADATQGFTYGFFYIHVDGQPDRRAKYLAYWRKEAAGWRAIAYRRNVSNAGTISTAMRDPSTPAVMLPVRPSPQLVSKYRDSLAARERAFSAHAHDVGLKQAFLDFGAPDAMNLNGGSPDFAFGPTAIAAGLPADVPSPVIWGPDEGVVVSSTGDLGITFGYIRPTGSLGTIPYYTIWRRDSPNGEWQYVAE
jgi:hypothetical protein